MPRKKKYPGVEEGSRQRYHKLRTIQAGIAPAVSVVPTETLGGTSKKSKGHEAHDNLHMRGGR